MRNRRAYLSEATRGDLLRRSRYQSKTRYQKRLNYRISDFRGVDLKELFNNDTFVYNTPIKDYICTVSFDKALTAIKRYVKNTNSVKDITLQMIAKALLWAYNDSDNVKIGCTCGDFCLHPDTEIKLLSSEVITVKDMLDRHNNGEDLWVYSTDEKGDFKPGHVKDVWVKGYVKEFIKVTLDNGKEVITTPEHLYMKRNGEYIEAKDLKVDDSLMPLYFLNCTGTNGYETVKINSDTKAGYLSVYKVVADEVLQEGIEEAKVRSGEDTVVIHHKNFNKIDNRPENLYPMGKNEHWMYHATYISTRRKEDKEFDTKLREAGRQHCYELNANPTEALKKARSELGKARCAELNSGETKVRLDKHRSECQIKYWGSMTEEERKAEANKRTASIRSGEGKERHRQSVINSWHNRPEEEIKKRMKIVATNLNGEHGEKASKRVKNYWSKLSDEERRQHTRKSADKKCELILKYLVEQGYALTEDNYEKHSKEVYKRPLSINVINQHFGTFNGMLEHFGYDNYNHRVVNVEYITSQEVIPVYDIEVEKWNNFYVDAGVILHNCYRHRFWATQGGYVAGAKETRPAKIRNPENNIGAACKHLDLLLANESWIGKSASVITQFIKAFPEKASYYLYDDYKDRKKLSFDDYDKQDTEDEDTLELQTPDEETEETVEEV